MKSENQLREEVRNKYASIALSDGKENCCGPKDCGPEYSMIGDQYDGMEGHVEDADLGLGCGLPTKFARINPGQTVVDLGSGAGNDAFIARAETGDSGRVIGIDFTQEMVTKAKINTEKLGYSNVEFREGSIEDIPMKDNQADVVVSNCVFNLIPNKHLAFKETLRILKPGGHFSISDIVVDGPVPKELQEKAELYVGCVSGAVQKSEYLNLIQEVGFKNIQIQKERKIDLPEDLLGAMLTEEERKLYEQSDIGIYSLTVYGEKEDNKKSCC